MSKRSPKNLLDQGKDLRKSIQKRSVEKLNQLKSSGRKGVEDFNKLQKRSVEKLNQLRSSGKKQLETYLKKADNVQDRLDAATDKKLKQVKRSVGKILNRM